MRYPAWDPGTGKKHAHTQKPLDPKQRKSEQIDH